MILSNTLITKAQTRLCGCTVWSGPLLFANPENRFSHVEAHIFPRENSKSTDHIAWMPRIVCTFASCIQQKQIYSWCNPLILCWILVVKKSASEQSALYYLGLKIPLVHRSLWVPWDAGQLKLCFHCKFKFSWNCLCSFCAAYVPDLDNFIDWW